MAASGEGGKDVGHDDSQEQEQQAPVKPKAGLMDELQDAIQACFSGLVGAEQRLDQTAMDIRANAEPSLHQLLEVARQLEAHFIRRRYHMVCVKPEWLVREEVQDMRAELRRREDLLLTHKHKVHHWRQMLAAAGPGAPSLPGGAHGGGGGGAHAAPARPQHGPPRLPVPQPRRAAQPTPRPTHDGRRSAHAKHAPVWRRHLHGHAPARHGHGRGYGGRRWHTSQHGGRWWHTSHTTQHDGHAAAGALLPPHTPPPGRRTPGQARTDHVEHRHAKSEHDVPYAVDTWCAACSR